MARQSDEQSEMPSAEQIKASVKDAIAKLIGVPASSTDARARPRKYNGLSEKQRPAKPRPLRT